MIEHIERQFGEEYPGFEFDPRVDKSEVGPPLSVENAFPVSEFMSLINSNDSSNNFSPRLIDLASKEEVMEYFAHRYWVTQRQLTQASDGEKRALREDPEYKASQMYLSNFGGYGEDAVRQVLVKKFKFEDGDFEFLGRGELIKAYFYVFDLTLSMSDNFVAKEFKEQMPELGGSSLWNIVSEGRYEEAYSILSTRLKKKAS